VATWFWAATEAQNLGLSTAKAPLTTLQNIVAMNPAAQAAILAIPSAGNWNFNLVPNTPPAGTVLVWPAGGTHSAIVTANDQITGYNQGAQLPLFVNNTGRTNGRVSELGANQKQCHTVSEAAIVAQAAAFNL
jgi:hypothetical protein